MKLDFNLTILNKPHMAARFLMEVLRFTERYQCQFHLKYGYQEVDITDWVDLLPLGSCLTTEIEISAEGEDAAQAVESIRYLFTRHLNEMSCLLN